MTTFGCADCMILGVQIRRCMFSVAEEINFPENVADPSQCPYGFHAHWVKYPGPKSFQY